MYRLKIIQRRNIEWQKWTFQRFNWKPLNELFCPASIEHALYLCIKIVLKIFVIGLHDSLHANNNDTKWIAKKTKTEP